jgi:hypothetical protein
VPAGFRVGLSLHTYAESGASGNSAHEEGSYADDAYSLGCVLYRQWAPVVASASLCGPYSRSALPLRLPCAVA